MTRSLLESDSGAGVAEPFLAVARHVYRDDRRYCASPPAGVLESVDRPDFRGAQRVFVAAADGAPVARLVARRSPLEDARGRPYGLIGFFEAVDDRKAVAELFGAAFAWLGRHGVAEVVGPMDGDTWHSYRLAVGPWDEPPFLMEPYNPRYYPRLWEDAGFNVRERYHSTWLEDLAGAMASLEAKWRAVSAAGYALEPLRLDRFDDELGRFHALSREIFRGNFLYSEIPRGRFVELYRGARRLVDPDLVRFAVAPDGTDAGFLFAFPDRFRAVAAMGGKRGPLAMLRYLTLRGRAGAVNLKSLGVVSAHRRSGLGAALMYEGYRVAARKGYRRVNLCLFIDGNPSGGLEGGLARPLREYHLYSRPLAAGEGA